MTRPARHAVMVWGTTSGAGKSLVATALCAVAARRGIDVAPFKAQNMSNNARVVALPDGFGEIGAAQYFQARAAGVAPSVDMNPVLLKPERDTASQVVLQGRVARAWSATPWRERSVHLAAIARESFLRLRSKHELIVLEGAGSPAEINLAADDFVNLGAARWAAEAGTLASILVTDIDRGGAFAHCWGTWAMLPDDLKPTLAGFVLNKFRGEASLLAPGPGHLQALTGVPVAGVLPMWRDHGLPDEDGLFGSTAAGRDGLRVAIVAYPRISNLDEFEPLRHVSGVRLAWARRADELADADWIVLPGSKQVIGDLGWVREAGIDRAIARHAGRGLPVLGICGGLQMLGARLDDPEGIDGTAGIAEGLGLLPLETRYRTAKRVTRGTVRFAGVEAPWAALRNIEAEAYEIRHGDTTATEAIATALCDDAGRAVGWQRGSVLGVAVHGLFESPATMEALFGVRARTLDDTFRGLADWFERHVEPTTIDRWLGGVPA